MNDFSWSSALSEAFIHDTAIVEEGVALGPASRVWHHSHLRTGCVIGAGCNLGKNVFVDEGVAIGDRVKIQNNVSVYRGVSIEHDVFVGPSAVFTNDRVPRAFADSWQVVPTLVREGASIGANATIVCGVEIGRFALVAAGAVVVRDVADHEVVAGSPAKRIGWVCRCGTVTVRAGGPEALDCRCGGAGR